LGAREQRSDGGAVRGGARDGERELRRIAWSAALVAVLTRLPFAARRLWDHDSVQFALGVEKYDLAAHHPHPPGYPLYIAILKALAAFGVSAQRGMVGLAILAAALGGGLIVPLTARLMRAAAGRGGAGRAGAGRAGDDAGRAGDDAGWAGDGEGRTGDGQAAGGDGPAGAGAGWAGDWVPGDAGIGPEVALAAALLAAALYVFNPLLWFYGELPLIYALEGGMTVGLAYAALRMADGPLPFAWGCAAFALAGGLRPSSLVLLLPLFLLGVWRAWRRGLGWGALAAGAAIAVAGGLSWLLPMLAAAGGYSAYQRIGREHFNALLPYTSILFGAGWRALAHNLTLMLKWFLQGLLPAAVTAAALSLAGLLGAGVRKARAHRGRSGGGPKAAWGATAAPARSGPARTVRGATGLRDGLRLLGRSALFLIVWALPSMMFFALFHITKAGYTLVYLPVLLVAVALAAAPKLAGPRGRRVLRGPAGAAMLLAAGTGAALFLFGADRRPDQPRALAVVRNEFNRGAIATFERDLDRLLAILHAYPPAATVLATVELSGTGPGGPESFLYPWQRHLQWYLPDYEVLHLVPEERLAFVTVGHRPFRRAGPAFTLPAATRQIAIVLSGPTGDRFPLARWPLQHIGATFDLVVVPFSGHLHLEPFDFTAPAADGRRRAPEWPKPSSPPRLLAPAEARCAQGALKRSSAC
jgi:hypothetical protein